MRKLIIMVVVGAILAVAVPAIGSQSEPVVGRLVDTEVNGLPLTPEYIAELLTPGDTLGVNWVSGSIWHVRKLPATDTLKSLDGTETLGFLTRDVSFNLDLEAFANGQVVSQAWGSWTLELVDGGSFSGRFNGDIIEGRLNAHDGTSKLSGTYRFEAENPAAIPVIGPYLLDLTLTTR